MPGLSRRLSALPWDAPIVPPAQHVLIAYGELLLGHNLAWGALVHCPGLGVATIALVLAFVGFAPPRPGPRALKLEIVETLGISAPGPVASYSRCSWSLISMP